MREEILRLSESVITNLTRKKINENQGDGRKPMARMWELIDWIFI